LPLQREPLLPHNRVDPRAAERLKQTIVVGS
jgi:hypothetical protein